MPRIPLLFFLLTTLSLSFTSALTPTPAAPAPRHRFLQRRAPHLALALALDERPPLDLHRRQQTGGNILNPFDPATSEPATSTSPTSPAVTSPPTTTTSDRGGILDPILSSITATSTSQVVSTTDTRVSSRSSSRSSLAVVTSTSTSGLASLSGTLPPLSSASGASQQKEDDGGGIGKGTLIAVIVIASCVGGVAAIWTVIRKWKFSPSKRFEEKLQPLDFGPGANKDIDNSSQTGLVRHGSNAKSDISAHSWGRGQGQGQGAGLNRADTTAGGWPSNPYAMSSQPSPHYGQQTFGSEYYPPPPQIPYGQQNLARNNSWGSQPAGGGTHHMQGGYGQQQYGGRYI